MPNNKTTRTASGSGSIRQRSDGRWEARLTLGHDEGTGKRKTLSIYGSTQKEVKQKLTEKLRQLDTNSYIADDKRTVAQYLDTWFEEFIAPTQKPYTVTSYKGIIENHLKPNIGAVRLCDLTTEQVQKMVRKLVNEGKAPKTIKNVLTVLNSALEQAVKAQTIQRNPARYAKLPAVRVKEIHPLTPSEIVAFVGAAQGSVYYAPLMCCLFLGLREGEALGLAWEHIDFERCKATICQQLQKEKNKGGQFYIQQGTKNGKSRVLDVPEFLLEVLAEEKNKQLRARMAAGPAWCNQWNLCFTDALGRPIKALTLWKHCKRIAANIGLPELRVHDLRHTNATLALVNGDDLKTVQANLGHATAAFTLQRYVHASEQMKRESANRMQQFFENNVKKA